MTAYDFRATLSRLGLTQVGAARLFGVSDRIVRAWASGFRPVPPLVEKVLGLLVAGKIVAADLE